MFAKRLSDSKAILGIPLSRSGHLDGEGVSTKTFFRNVEDVKDIRVMDGHRRLGKPSPLGPLSFFRPSIAKTLRKADSR
jgi:hypothetical protein